MCPPMSAVPPPFAGLALPGGRRVAALACAAALLLVACGPARPLAAADPPGHIRLSLLALGDTGRRPAKVGHVFQPQMRVARALAAEQRRRPADALVLLGDNFYPNGLRSEELVLRVRENLVRPYCMFLALDGPESAQVADACPPGQRGPHPVPLYAFLGNHDIELPESPKLEREAVPRFVPNWHVTAGSVETIELLDSDRVPSVSLVLYDALTLENTGDTGSLARALRASRGPFRILADHYPINDSNPGPWIRHELAAIDVPVQLHLAGHEHNLQIGVPAPASPYLQVVSGGGSGEREVKHPIDGARFAAIQPGFARVDLVGDGADARLFVTLVALPVHALASLWTPPRAIARWSVGLGGDVREEPLGGS
jgi:hypothetical protein